MDQQLQLVHCVLPRWFGDEPPASVKLWQAAGSHSGAAVWRVSCGERDYCLRRWPTTGPSPRRLAAIHQFQQRLSANGSEITPTLIPATGSATQVEHRQAAWHLETWRPGAADLQRPVSEEKLAAAVQAVAQIHLVAQSCDTADGDGAVPRRAPSPAVARRAGLAEELLRNGCRDLATKASRFPAGACRDLAVATVRAIETKLPHVARRMAGCREAVLPLGWRLGDARREHVLFTGDAVTGVVDFGAAGVDTPVGDLVRLLGSFVADDSDRWRRGIEAYQSVRPLSDVELRVIEPLRHSEPLLAAANWIGWLSAGAQPADHRDHPGWLRLAELYQRLQSP